MTSLAALTQAISNTSPSVAATNFSNYSSANIPSPKYSPPSAQNNIVNWKNNSSVKSPNNQSNVSSDGDDPKDPIASFLKWLGTKVVPDAALSFLTYYVTYLMAHNVLATSVKGAWYGKIPGMRGIHNNIVEINNAIRNHLGSEQFAEIMEGIGRPGSRRSGQKFWEEGFDKIKDNIHTVPKTFINSYETIFRKCNRLFTGLTIAILSYSRAVFFTSVRSSDDNDGNKEPEYFSLSSIMAAAFPLICAAMYWTFYEGIPSRSLKFAEKFYSYDEEKNLFKLGKIQMYFGDKHDGKLFPGSMQSHMNRLIAWMKNFLKGAKRFRINLAKPTETITSVGVSLTTAALARNTRTDGTIISGLFSNLEKLINYGLKPFNKRVNLPLSNFQGLENTLYVPGFSKDNQPKDLNPGYNPSGNGMEAVYLSIFKTLTKIPTDIITFLLAFKFMNWFSQNDDEKHKKAKQSNSSSSNEKTKQQWTLPQTAGLGLTIAAATAIPVAYSLSEEDDRERKQKKNGRQLSYA
jgi:hypothetical protein